MFFIVCEDQLSEVVMRKMIAHYSSFNRFNIVPLGKRGRGYIQAKINDLNSNGNFPFFILADLDMDKCAPGLIRQWMRKPCRRNMVFRIAIREVESWLLADIEGFSRYLKIEHSFVRKEVNSPDLLINPKEKLISLVDRCKSNALKNDIVRKERSAYRQGPGYNSRLADYVINYWDIERAAVLSDSFKRAINSLGRLSEDLVKG